MKQNRRKVSLGPITIMLLISAILAVASLILSKIGFQSYMTDPDTFETVVIAVRNIFSREGIQFIFGESITNFRALEPLAVLVVSLISVTILEESGLFHSLTMGFQGTKPWLVTFITLFISIVASAIGDYSYAILFPLAAILYKYLNRDPKLGIMTVFIGVTMGYGAGILYSYQDVVLGNMAEVASLDVLNTYSFGSWSMIFMEIAATFVLSILGTYLIEKKLSKKIRRIEEKERIYSPKALKITLAIFAVVMLIVFYAIIPGLPFSGWLLDANQPTYMEKLFSEYSPFRQGILVILLSITLICGYVYGKISRNIKSSKEYNQAISLTFQNTGFIFAGLFFFSIMFNILEWTNIGDVLSLKLINLLSGNQMNGVFLICLVFLVSILITIINPTTTHNWLLASPIVVPLMIRANISPSFSLMVFKAADSIGKCFTPFYVFFIVMIGFLYKYDTQDEDIQFFGTMKKIMPVVLWLTLAWFVIIIGWNLLGIQIGIGASSTL